MDLVALFLPCKEPEDARGGPAAFKEGTHLPPGKSAAVVLMSHMQVNIKLDQVNIKLDQVLARMINPAAAARAAGASTSALPLQQQQQPKLDISTLKCEIVSILGWQAFESPLFFGGQPAITAATTFILKQLTTAAKDQSAFYPSTGTVVDGRANKAILNSARTLSLLPLPLPLPKRPRRRPCHSRSLSSRPSRLKRRPRG